MERDARKLRKLPLVLLAGLLLLCLGLYGFLYYFGSPLLPGSLERRYAGQVEAHQEELFQVAQAALQTGKAPEELPLPGTVKQVELWNYSVTAPEAGAGAFYCQGWGLTPSASYYGFYYAPKGPVAFPGVDVPLRPQGHGYTWEQEDNRGYTCPLGGGFYYYEAHF